MPPRQKYTSAKTCRAQVPALHRALLRARTWKPWDTNADIGGGKYELATDELAEHGVGNVVYDKFNRPPEFNKAALKVITKGLMTATMANVLNCIMEPHIRAELIQLAAQATSPRRMAYFTVYEGDRSGVGRETRDGWQENRPLESYVMEIEDHFDVVCVAVVEGVRCIVAYGSRVV